MFTDKIPEACKCYILCHLLVHDFWQYDGLVPYLSLSRNKINPDTLQNLD